MAGIKVRDYKIKLTDEQITSIEKMASLGFSRDVIAKIIGICRNTLDKCGKDNKRVREAFDSGRDKADINIVSSLYQKAMDGDITALIFWLKNRKPADWRDKQEVQTTEMIKADDIDLDSMTDKELEEYTKLVRKYQKKTSK